MFKNRLWFTTTNLWKPKNVHSLEYLKYLYAVLSKIQKVEESNENLLIECFRLISEILIWGDQNDSSVFDFFLEKNMLSFFQTILKQNCGNYIPLQLLQTLNILFENIKNETSLYYLLSNNHINSIISHEFDFSNEEVTAYYISFLKVLSLKLNDHTIHFFYNESTNEFPLYTKSVKFFNHSESMIRISVRTITLNIYKAGGKSVLNFIQSSVATSCFLNFISTMKEHIYEIETNICDMEKNKNLNVFSLVSKIGDHLNNLHYISDILSLNKHILSEVLISHFIKNLILPVHFNFLAGDIKVKAHSSEVISLALYLLTQIFLIIKFEPLLKLIIVIVNQGRTGSIISTKIENRNWKVLIKSGDEESDIQINQNLISVQKNVNVNYLTATSNTNIYEASSFLCEKKREVNGMNLLQPFYIDCIYDCLIYLSNTDCIIFPLGFFFVFLKSYMNFKLNGMCLNDGSCLIKNKDVLIKEVVNIICTNANSNSQISLVILCIAAEILKKLLCMNENINILDEHLAYLENSKEKVLYTIQEKLKNCKSEEIILHVFENENLNIHLECMDIENLLMDSEIILYAFPNILKQKCVDSRNETKIEVIKRIFQKYLILKDLFGCLYKEASFPSGTESEFHCEDILDFSKSDLLACTAILNDKPVRLFLVVNDYNILLVEPYRNKFGWGTVKLVGCLWSLQIYGVKNDSRSLQVIFQKTSMKKYGCISNIENKLIFDDHIRCMAAKQRLTKGKTNARKKRIQEIFEFLNFPHECLGDLKSLTDDKLMKNEPFANLELQFQYRKFPGYAAVCKMDKDVMSSESSRTFSFSLEENRNSKTVKQTNNLQNLSRKALKPFEIKSKTKLKSDIKNEIFSRSCDSSGTVLEL